MGQITDIVLELSGTEDDIREEICDLGNVAQISTAKRLDGNDLVYVIIALGSASIPVVAKIIIERIRANSHVILRCKGMTISGLNADDVVKVLKELNGSS